MAQAALTSTTFPAFTCRPSDIERLSFDGARWLAVRIRGAIFIREDQLEDMLDDLVSAEAWIDELRSDELAWVDTGEERTFVHLSGVLRVVLTRTGDIMPGSAAARFVEWASRLVQAVPAGRRYGHLVAFDGGLSAK